MYIVSYLHMCTSTDIASQSMHAYVYVCKQSPTACAHIQRPTCMHTYHEVLVRVLFDWLNNSPGIMMVMDG